MVGLWAPGDWPEERRRALVESPSPARAPPLHRRPRDPHPGRPHARRHVQRGLRPRGVRAGPAPARHRHHRQRLLPPPPRPRRAPARHPAQPPHPELPHPRTPHRHRLPGLPAPVREVPPVDAVLPRRLRPDGGRGRGAAGRPAPGPPDRVVQLLRESTALGPHGERLAAGPGRHGVPEAGRPVRGVRGPPRGGTRRVARSGGTGHRGLRPPGRVLAGSLSRRPAHERAHRPPPITTSPASSTTTTPCSPSCPEPASASPSRPARSTRSSAALAARGAGGSTRPAPPRSPRPWHRRAAGPHPLRQHRQVRPRHRRSPPPGCPYLRHRQRRGRHRHRRPRTRRPGVLPPGHQRGGAPCGA